MAKQYWLQYHSFEKYGPPGFAGINTNKNEFLSRIRWGKHQDIILLILGLRPTVNNLLECELPLSIREQVDTNRQIYMLWEKFTAENYDIRGKQFGDFDYTIFGNDCVDFRKQSIILQSSEFKDFWDRHNRRGLICLSDYRVPFPELEEIGEGLIFRPGRNSQKSELNISEKVLISQDVWKGIEFIRKRLPKNQLYNPVEVSRTLKEYGYNTTADWIKSHPKEYIGGWKVGFQVETKA